jgi:hypothetical protein
MTMNEKIAVPMFVQFFQWILIAICITTIPFLTTFLYLGGDWYYPIIIFLQLILFLLFIINKAEYISLKKSDQTWLIVWMFPLIGFILYALAHIYGDGGESRVLIAFVNKYVVFTIGVIVIRSCYINFVRQYLFICHIMIALSVILFFLLVSGVFSFTPELVFENEEEPHYNFLLGNTNVWTKIGKTQIIRIAGWMEEPGALALLITYLLMINELLFQSKWQRILLHIAGFLTFSMAFIVSILFLFPLWWKGALMITERLYCYFKKKYLFINICLIGIVPIVLINIVQVFSMDFSFADSKSAVTFQLMYTIRRFSYDPEKGSLRGDNRFYIEHEVDNIWFGDGEKTADVASLQAIIEKNGIIPVILFYIPIIFLTIQIFIKIGPRRGKWFIMIIWANLIQRPYIDNLYLMILWTVIYFALDNKHNFTLSIENTNG